MKQLFDIVVAGGGPAGSAAAVDLSRRGFHVALIEAALIEQSSYDDFRVGETLPPEIRVSLTKLGIWEQFLATDFLESYGIRSAWETPFARHRDFIFNPYGCGWHVDRARFDAMLACAAARAGAELLTPARITGVDRMRMAAGFSKSCKKGQGEGCAVACSSRPRAERLPLRANSVAEDGRWIV